MTCFNLVHSKSIAVAILDVSEMFSCQVQIGTYVMIRVPPTQITST